MPHKLPPPRSRSRGSLKAAILALVVASPRAAHLWREMHARAFDVGASDPTELSRDAEYAWLCDALTEELLRWMLRSGKDVHTGEERDAP